MTQPARLLAALTDKACSALAETGDKIAQAEMIRRGLAGDPVMVAEARRKGKRSFKIFDYDERPRPIDEPMARR